MHLQIDNRDLQLLPTTFVISAEQLRGNASVGI